MTSKITPQDLEAGFVKLETLFYGPNIRYRHISYGYGLFVGSRLVRREPCPGNVNEVRSHCLPKWRGFEVEEGG